jgi:predicted house-cleaning noncanonical NTP pyrophosphatase (MazG superfamily)
MKKLVRDRIPEILIKLGKSPVCYEADHDEYRMLLREKLQEETQEFLEAGSLEELADVLEVIEAIIHAYQIDRDQLDEVQATKRHERGGFKNRIVLVHDK